MVPNGHYLVTHYGDQVVREYDSQGKLAREIPAAGGPHSAIRLASGNTLVSDSLGHGQFGKAPHLIEATADKKVVWTFADHQAFKTISSVQLLDVPGDVTKGEIAH